MTDQSNSRYDLQSISMNPGNDSAAANYQLQYQLPYPITLSGYDVALSSLFLFYSWPNITALPGGYGDNILQYNFPGATGTNPTTVTFANGQYGLDDIGNYIQFTMGQNGQYLLDQNGDPVYYLTVITNPTYYAATIVATPVPASLPSGWSNPNSIDLSGLTPQLIIPAPQAGATYTMNQLLGFQSGTYPPTPQSTLYMINSNGTGDAGVPQITPTNAVNVNLNIVSSSYFNVNPSTIYTFSATDTVYGAQIQIIPPALLWLKCIDNQFTQLVITLTDQNGMNLTNLDNQIVCGLYFRKLEGSKSIAR
jgi:hypothetical protein